MISLIKSLQCGFSTFHSVVERSVKEENGCLDVLNKNAFEYTQRFFAYSKHKAYSFTVCL